MPAMGASNTIPSRLFSVRPSCKGWRSFYEQRLARQTIRNMPGIAQRAIGRRISRTSVSVIQA
jgi:hypothetical protein